MFRTLVSGLIGEDKSSDRHAGKNAEMTATRARGRNLKGEK
jgi:hypothetical protein